MNIQDALAYKRKNTPVSQANTQGLSTSQPKELSHKPSTTPPTSHVSQASSDTLATPNITEPAQKPTLQTVNINIAGTTHRITCPSNEVANLEKSAEYLNKKILDLRQAIKSRNPNNEDLLVLICLEMHDKLSELQHQQSLGEQMRQQEQALLDNILQEAQSILYTK